MENKSEILNITPFKSHRKCHTIFKQFDALKEGESFIMEINQDPVNLYHHLLGERSDPFGWERIEDGPSRWRVKISKPGAEQGSDLSIGEIAALDYRKAEIFQKFGINYCCGGKKTLKEACREAGIQQEILEQFYAEAIRYRAKEVYAFGKWEVDFLADYIVNTHHGYIKRNVQNLLDLSSQVAARHGEEHPEFSELAERLGYFLADLKSHLKKEEEVLFPQIKKLAASKKKHKTLISPDIKGIRSSIRKLEKEHQQAGFDLKFFKKLTRNYRLPENACDSCTHLYAKLLEFENDLVQHIHLENNLLFPKALELEKELAGSRPKAFIKQIRRVS